MHCSPIVQIQQTTLNALQELSSASVASATLAQLHGTPYHLIFIQSLTLTPLNGTYNHSCSQRLSHSFVSAPGQVV